jgi:hypothetical protein
VKRITTITGSVYYLDGQAIVRIPGGHSNSLRADNEVMEICARGGITIGQPMVLLLLKRPPKTYTTRLTTPVVSIEELSSREIEDLLTRKGGEASTMELATTE